MEQDVLLPLLKWGKARKEVDGNPEAIIHSNGSDAVMRICAQRMKTLQEAEQALFDLEGRVGLPAPLETFLRARNDRGCTSCEMSSFAVHEECERKIVHYFRSVENLEAYVTGLTN